MRVSLLLVLVAWGAAGCNSSKPVDCEKISPEDCHKYSHCEAIGAGRTDESCVYHTYFFACRPNDRPTCEQIVYLRDLDGICWAISGCVLPQGWGEGWSLDGGLDCGAEMTAIRKACFARDAAITPDGADPDGGVP